MPLSAAPCLKGLFAVLGYGYPHKRVKSQLDRSQEGLGGFVAGVGWAAISSTGH